MQPRYDKLRELQSLLHGEVKQVPEGTSVRWLSVESAVKMIYKFYDSIVMSLEDDKDKTGKAKGIWLFLSTSLFVLVTALMVDILTAIGILSLTFQMDNVNIGSIHTNVETTISTLEQMREGSNTVDTVLREIDTDNQMYRDIKISDNQNLRARFLAVRRQFINNIIENLKSRFPAEELSILESFDKLFNPRRYPAERNNLATYGNNELEVLCQHFVSINKDECMLRFLHFKHLVHSYRLTHTFIDMIQLLLGEYSQMYPDLVKLASIAAVIPVSSAPCERGFSQQNILKNKTRNRLNPERLNRLLMIRLTGPKLLDMDFIGVCRSFNNMKDRRK